ncbi:hypothetical protein P9209_12550 [Prescottella defluvii]|nr:hypothetical protein P9209_12550 [Prescottella defluvii]
MLASAPAVVAADSCVFFADSVVVVDCPGVPCCVVVSCAAPDVVVVAPDCWP